MCLLGVETHTKAYEKENKHYSIAQSQLRFDGIKKSACSRKKKIQESIH